MVMGDWNLVEILFNSDSNSNTLNLQSPKVSQGMANHVGFTFSVGNTTLGFTISNEQDG